MPTELTQLSKRQSAPFILDRGKLSCIVSIVETTTRDAQIPIEVLCEVALTNGKQIALSDAQALLSLDNAVKNPVQSLDIRCESSDAMGAPFLEGTVHFDSESRANIRLEVTCTNSRVANDLFSSLEEQIDRAISYTFVTRYLKSAYASALLPLTVATGSAAAAVGVLLRTGRESPEQLRATLERLATASTDTQRLSALVAAQQSELNARLHESTVSFPDLGALLTWKGLFIAVPVLALLGMSYYLVKHCYPWTVLAWGDVEDQFNQLVKLRGTLGTVIIASLVVGVLGNLFVASIGLP